MTEKEIETVLAGKTLKVYMLLVKNAGESMGVRKVQKALGLSSPSVAHHHLEKLVSLGLAKKTERGEYTVAEVVKIGILKSFVMLGKLLLPKYIFYSVLLTTMLISYVLIYPQDLSMHNVAALLIGLVSTIILWYEALNQWRGLFA